MASVLQQAVEPLADLGALFVLAHLAFYCRWQAPYRMRDEAPPPLICWLMRGMALWLAASWLLGLALALWQVGVL